jgi:alpha-D-ribose 1-methylphosphonate 5-triphosphate synthase subunit PhnL
MSTALSVSGLVKHFTVHAQGGVRMSVLDGVSLSVARGECLALVGPSGAGKSTLLRSLYGNYRPQSGSILVDHDGRVVDMVAAEPREILDVRRRTIGYVSQFLRVIPRVATLDLVAEPLIRRGVEHARASARAGTLLERLGVPARLWKLPPATFSGGEQQRVNIARCLVADFPVLLLDEPTASLDRANWTRAVELIAERRDAGAAIVGIFHDSEVRDLVATRTHDLQPIGGSA